MNMEYQQAYKQSELHQGSIQSDIFVTEIEKFLWVCMLKPKIFSNLEPNLLIVMHKNETDRRKKGNKWNKIMEFKTNFKVSSY